MISVVKQGNMTVVACTGQGCVTVTGFSDIRFKHHTDALQWKMTSSFILDYTEKYTFTIRHLSYDMMCLSSQRGPPVFQDRTTYLSQKIRPLM